MTIFAKVSVELLLHQRVLRIQKSRRAGALGVWLAALLYTRDHELDGFCPLDGIKHLATREYIDALVEAELVSRQEQDGIHGVTILRYAEHNETKQQISERRRSDRLRKVKRIPNGSPPESDWKEARALSSFPTGIPQGFRSDSLPQGIPDSDSVSVSEIKSAICDSKIEPVEVKSAVRLKNAQADGAFGLAVSAFADGIRSVTGKPFVLPAGGSVEMSKLCGALREHFADDATRVDRTRESSIAFAKTNRGKLSAHSFVDWLNSPPQSLQDAPGLTNGPRETPEQHRARLKREDAEQDATHARRIAGAGGPPERLSVMLERQRAELAAKSK